jgi:hypothetical protein
LRSTTESESSSASSNSREARDRHRSRGGATFVADKGAALAISFRTCALMAGGNATLAAGKKSAAAGGCRPLGFIGAAGLLAGDDKGGRGASGAASAIVTLNVVSPARITEPLVSARSTIRFSSTYVPLRLSKSRTRQPCPSASTAKCRLDISESPGKW